MKLYVLFTIAVSRKCLSEAEFTEILAWNINVEDFYCESGQSYLGKVLTLKNGGTML